LDLLVAGKKEYRLSSMINQEMANRMRVNKTLLKIAILAVGVQDIGGGAASPVLADIMKAMPSVAPTTVMLITTIPTLGQLLMSFFFGKLTEYFRKRSLFFSASAVFLAAGLGPFFLNGIIPILACRFILGLSIGVFVPMGVALITDFFEDPQEINQMNGLNLTVACFGGMAFQMIGGFLAKINWHYCFLAYLSSIFVFLIVFFWMPEPPKKEAAASSSKGKLPGGVYGIAILYGVANMILMAIVTNNAVSIVMNGYGDAGTAGISLTGYTAGGLIGGILFGYLARLFRQRTLSLGYLIAASGFGLAFVAGNATMIIVGTFIVGLSMGMIIPGSYEKIQRTAPPALIGAGIGLACSFQGLGQFFQAIIYNPILKMVGGPGKPAFEISAVAFAVLFVLALIIPSMKKGKSAV
jgi:MFS family permease